MPNLTVGTDYVSNDEFCVSLVEVKLVTPDKQAWNRYQIIYVIRNDKVAEYRTDMGLASNYFADEFRIASAIGDEATGDVELTVRVGEARDIADGLREDRSPAEETEKRDFIGDWIKQQEERQRLTSGQSTFGPGGNLIRGSV
jgi:hypothetical protein